MKHILLIMFLIVIVVISYLFFDRDIALYFSKHDVYKNIFEFFTSFGRSEKYLIPSLLVYIIFRKREIVKKYAILVFASVAISGIIADIIKVIVARYRPTMLIHHNLYGFSWFDIGYSVNSFPSGHATTAFAAMLSFAYIWPKYKPFFISLACLIALSRVVLDAHYPSDIITGATLGGYTTYITYKKLFGKLVPHHP